MAESFIFGGNTPWTYEQLQRKRQIADQLAAGIGTPRNVGEGLSAIGKALAARGINKRADARDAELKAESEARWAPILAGFSGGGAGGGQGGTGTALPIAPLDPNSPQAIGADAMKALGKQPNYPSQEEITAYISEAAAARGIDPEIAVRVAASEGLNANPAEGWQSNFVKDGKREESYGPFQLYLGGGLGNKFMDETKLDPRNPQTWQQQVDFALNHAAQNGWDSWYGAANSGIGDMQGIGSAAAPVNMGALIQLAGDPYATPGQKAIVEALLGQQIDAMDPAKRLELERAQLEIEQLRNPTPDPMKDIQLQQAELDLQQDRDGAGGDIPSSFTALDLQAKAAGYQPGTPEYQNFMRTGGGSGVPAAFESLDLQAKAAGFQPGTLEYKEFMATRGAGMIAAAKAKGEDSALLASLSSKFEGLEKVVTELEGLADEATYTWAGRAIDAGRTQFGLEPRDAAVARANYIAKVDNQVLPMLRDTFGAAFTVKEGETLRATLGDPNKTPAEKKAVLRAFIDQKKRDIQALEVRTGEAGVTESTGKTMFTYNPETGELE